MRDYKIVFSDIDGTLLNKERELSSKTISAVKILKDRVPFILVSARMPAAMRHLQQELEIEDQPYICYNGGLILVNNEIRSSTVIPVEIVEEFSNWNLKLNCHLSLYHNEDWYVPVMDKWAIREEQNTKVRPQVEPNSSVIKRWKSQNKGAHKIMAMGKELQIDEIKNYLEKNFNNELHLYRSKNTYLEIAPKEISKFTAIEFLLNNHYNFSAEEAVTIGDNYNDVEMLKNSGYGVAVGNACQEAKDAANIVCGKSVEDGVAVVLKEIFNY